MGGKLGIILPKFESKLKVSEFIAELFQFQEFPFASFTLFRSICIDGFQNLDLDRKSVV